MTRQTTFQLFDPWGEPDENGNRLIHEVLVEGEPTEESVRAELKHSTEWLENAIGDGGFPDLDVREGVLRELTHMLAYGYAMALWDVDHGLIDRED